jgi:hypothetical protein
MGNQITPHENGNKKIPNKKITKQKTQTEPKNM